MYKQYKFYKLAAWFYLHKFAHQLVQSNIQITFNRQLIQPRAVPRKKLKQMA